MSGISLDHVRVHRNSSKPAAVQAHAYAQGSEIHLASGQDQHLPHELGHVVQQAQGRVKATTAVGGMAVNDNAGLESEATRMGEVALQRVRKGSDGSSKEIRHDFGSSTLNMNQQSTIHKPSVNPLQLKIGNASASQAVMQREGEEKTVETVKKGEDSTKIAGEFAALIKWTESLRGPEDAE